MMKLNRKVPAFTLMEVTISMLVAAVAIAIAFTAFRIVSGSYSGFTKKQDRVATLTSFDKVLKQDFLKANRILKSEDGLALTLEGGLIKYHFSQAYLVRDQFSLRTDTFKLAVNDIGFLFENGPVEEGSYVDFLNFKAVVDGDVVPLQYHKIYSAQDLFK